MQGPGSEPGATAGARCALHPVQPAQGVCERCGNYMCLECSAGGRNTVCPPCLQRTGHGPFPFTRASFDLGNVFSFAFERFKDQWVVPCLAFVILWVVSMAMSMLASGLQLGIIAIDSDLAPVGLGVYFLVTIVSYVVQVGMQLGLWAICLGILQGEQAELGQLFTHFGRVPAAIVQGLVLMVPFGLLIGLPIAAVVVLAGASPDQSAVVGVVGGVLALLFVPALVYVMLGLAYMQVELVQDPHVGPLDAMLRSWRIVSGYRLWVLVLFFALMALAFAGMLACCVGVIPATAFGSLAMTAVYLALRNGAEL